jgi:phage terminase small subunit
MSILRNPRHERFAQELAAGKSASEAYVLAGYRPNTGNAAALKGQECISTRVEEILANRERIEEEGLELAVERSAVTKQRVLEELARIGFANMFDYMRAGPDGDPILDFSALTRDQAAALVEVTVENFKDGRGDGARDVRRVKFKLADKKAALVALGRHLGLFTGHPENSDDQDGPKLTQAELDAIARQELLDYYGAVVDLDEPDEREEPEG